MANRAAMAAKSAMKAKPHQIFNQAEAKMKTAGSVSLIICKKWRK